METGSLYLGTLPSSFLNLLFRTISMSPDTIYRQTDRQTDTQIDTLADTQTHRQTYRHKYAVTYLYFD